MDIFEKERNIIIDNREINGFGLSKIILLLLTALILIIFIKSFLIEASEIPSSSMENTLLVGDYIIVNKIAYNFSTPATIPLTNITIPRFKLFNISKPKRNDVIVFQFPGYQWELSPSINKYFIKRIIGLPGDTVQIIKGKVYINNKMLEQPKNALLSETIAQSELPDNRIFPKGENWNRDNYGPIIVPYRGFKVNISFKNISDWKMLIDREFNTTAVSDEGTFISINGVPTKNYTFRKNYYFVLGDNREYSVDSRYWGFVPDNLIIGKAAFIYWSQNNSNFLKDPLEFIRLNRILNAVN